MKTSFFINQNDTGRLSQFSYKAIIFGLFLALVCTFATPNDNAKSAKPPIDQTISELIDQKVNTRLEKVTAELDGQKPKYYTTTGLIQNQQILIYQGVTSISTITSNITVDISMVPFNQILGVTITPIFPTASGTSMAQVTIVSQSTTQVVFRIDIINSVSIPVLTTSITALTYSTTAPSGLQCNVKVVGW